MTERSEAGRYLDALSALAKIYGDDLVRADIASIVEQAQTNAASVAFLGQFKRGKSSLVNALLGEDVLPTGRLPLTGVTTTVSYGERASIVRYLDGREERADVAELAAFVTEERNPENRLGVARVDVKLPLALLQDMVLIDTPGIGSTLAHNTQIAQEASERVDLAIFVTGPEPPMTSEEAAFLRQVHDLSERVIVVLAKLDLVRGAEREVLGFTRRVLDEALHRHVPLFSVNATCNDERVEALREAIVEAVAEGGGSLARRSRSRRAQRAALRLRRSLELRRAVALLPGEQRARAQEVFTELADEIDERGQSLIRAIEQFPTEELVSVDSLLDALFEEATAALRDDLGEFVDRGPSEGEQKIYERVAACESDWFSRVSRALEKRIEKRRASALKLLAELELRFAQAANEALGLQWTEQDAGDRGEFGAREAATRMTGPVPTTGLEIVTGGLIAALPGPLRSRALRKRYHALIGELLDRSRGRVRSAAVRYLLEWRLANVGQVRERLIAARRIVEDAFDRAARPAGDADLDAGLREMQRDERTLDAIVAALA
ncbi:MAG TPA: dynamin family protein [Candidatus Acidoferrales bacterium]|nr:dynamin family protein [Candidatus Acidoferrales bacterium]